MAFDSDRLCDCEICYLAPIANWPVEKGCVCCGAKQAEKDHLIRLQHTRALLCQPCFDIFAGIEMSPQKQRAIAAVKAARIEMQNSVKKK